MFNNSCFSGYRLDVRVSSTCLCKAQPTISNSFSRLQHLGLFVIKCVNNTENSRLDHTACIITVLRTVVQVPSIRIHRIQCIATSASTVSAIASRINKFKAFHLRMQPIYCTFKDRRSFRLVRIRVCLPPPAPADPEMLQSKDAAAEDQNKAEEI